MSTAARIIVGASIFALLASVDLYRNRARATRWREYLFLILCVLAAIIYGIVNDQITSRISWAMNRMKLTTWSGLPVKRFRSSGS